MERAERNKTDSATLKLLSELKEDSKKANELRDQESRLASLCLTYSFLSRDFNTQNLPCRGINRFRGRACGLHLDMHCGRYLLDALWENGKKQSTIQWNPDLSNPRIFKTP